MQRLHQVRQCTHRLPGRAELYRPNSSLEERDRGLREPLFDPLIREKARRYRERTRVGRLVGMAGTLGFGAVLFATPLTRKLAVMTGTYGVRTAWLLAVVLTLFAALQTSLGFFLGYRVQRAFDLSTQGPWAWLVDEIKSWLITLALSVPLLMALRWVMMSAGSLWWLYAGFGWIVVTVILANLFPIAIMPLFYKFVPLEDGHLAGRLQTLFQKAGVSIQGVYVMNMSSKTRAANAMITGLANTRRMILGDTLVQEYPADEIEVVMAHELGHHRLGHMPKLLAFESATGLIGFGLIALAAPALSAWLGYAGLTDPAFLPAVPFVMGLVLAVLAPLTNAFSRRLECESDQFALDLTRMPDSFISAMARLADQNLSIIKPPLWEEWLWWDHPPIANRIGQAERFKEQSGKKRA